MSESDDKAAGTPGETPSFAAGDSRSAPGRGAEPTTPEVPPLPARARRAHYSLWLVWLVPLTAVGIGISLGVRSILARGPQVTIYFRKADGIEAGKTHIRYKDVDMGVVRSVKLTPDHKGVEVTGDMRGNQGVESLLVTDTRFWVVTPHIGAAGVSGLGTLLSGAYIGMDAGQSTAAQREFQGLDAQPPITADIPGREFQLQADELGSLDIGSPVFYRRVPVGQVLSYEMTPDGHQVRFKVFVAAPYDRFVSGRSRFWNASGVDVDLDARGLHLQTQSLVSVLAGGVAFQDLPSEVASDQPEAAANTLFRLFSQQSEALRRPDTQGFDYRLLFSSSVRGLSVGAPVEFRGLPIGEVTRIAVQGHGSSSNPEPLIAVDVRIFPARLPEETQDPKEALSRAAERARVDPMVRHGYRAQLHTGNLLTGQLFVALEFFPRAAPASIDWATNPPLMPTIPGSLDSLQDSLADLAKKLDEIPFDQLSKDVHRDLTSLDTTLASVNTLVTNLNTGLAPEATKTVVEAQKAIGDLRKTLGTLNQTTVPQTTQTLNDVSRAATSLRSLADYLDRHPESLLKGKPEDPK